MFERPYLAVCKLFGKCKDTQAKMALHHKVPIATATYFAADKSFDMSREHLFLAAHEFSTHAGFIGYTLTGAGFMLFLSIIGAVFYDPHHKRSAENEQAQKQ